MLEIDNLIESNGLYKTVYPTGHSFTWRLLTIKESKVYSSLIASKTMRDEFIYESIFNRCYVGIAEMIDLEIPVGYIWSIGKLIFELSVSRSVDREKEELFMAREDYKGDSLFEYMKRVIWRAWSNIGYKDLENISKPEFLKMFVTAEKLLSDKDSSYQPIDLNSIKDPSKQNNKPTSKINFAKENAALHDAMGGSAGTDLIDLPPEEFARKMKIAKRMRGGGR